MCRRLQISGTAFQPEKLNGPLDDSARGGWKFYSVPRANARPSPEAAPVMMAVMFSIFISVLRGHFY